MTKLKMGSYSFDISHEDKIFFRPNITKADMIHYYRAIAPIMLKYIKNRPIMLHRFPDGAQHEGFYQKEAPDYFPDWIKRIKIPKKDGFTCFAICQNQASIVYLANQACITFHRWLSQANSLDYPNLMIFDLDPGQGQEFSVVCFIALKLKELMGLFGLQSFVMTTGSHGLHVIIPINKRYTFDQVRQFAADCAHILISEHPDIVTLELRKDKREGKLFVDTLRNQFGATAVAAYSIRAKPNAPVATPLYWHELDKNLTSAQKYNISNLFERIDKIGDPFEDLEKIKQSLAKPIKIITQLKKKYLR